MFDFNETKKRSVELANKFASYKVCSLLKDIGFTYPCLSAYDTVFATIKESDGTYFFDNTYPAEISRPTYGLVDYFLYNDCGMLVMFHHGEGKFDIWEKKLIEKLESMKRDKIKIKSKRMKDDFIEDNRKYLKTLEKEYNLTEAQVCNFIKDVLAIHFFMGGLTVETHEDDRLSSIAEYFKSQNLLKRILNRC